MLNAARRHHFLPQGYLAGFTDSGSKDGSLNVLSVQSGVSFCTTPLNLAVQKDFKRVDIEGRRPDAIETALAPIEDRAIQAIRQALETCRFPPDRDLNIILNLLSLLIAQNPKSRRLLHTIRSTLGRNETMIAEFEAQDEVLKALGQRTWSLLVANNEGPHFITSDFPFSLNMEHGYRGTPGFLVANTELYFPLSKTLGFIGVIGRPLNPIVNANPKTVAVMNQRVLRQADRQVFSSRNSFLVCRQNSLIELPVNKNP